MSIRLCLQLWAKFGPPSVAAASSTMKSADCYPVKQTGFHKCAVSQHTCACVRASSARPDNAHSGILTAMLATNVALSVCKLPDSQPALSDPTASDTPVNVFERNSHRRVRTHNPAHTEASCFSPRTALKDWAASPLTRCRKTDIQDLPFASACATACAPACATAPSACAFTLHLLCISFMF